MTEQRANTNKLVMNFTITRTSKYNIFNIDENKLTSEFAPSLKAELILQADRKKSIICNIEKIDYIDSSTVSCFLIGDKLCKDNKNQFIICNASEKTLDLIQTTKLNNLLTIIPTLQEAKDFILFDELEKEL